MTGYNTEKVLDERIRHTHGFLREMINLAEEQYWTMRIQNDGFLFFPPAEKRRPGYDKIFVRDPGTDSHRRKIIRDNLRRAGLIFPEDQPAKVKPKVAHITPVSKATALPTTQEPFCLARQKISETINLLSEIEQLLGKIESDNAKVRAFKEMLKSLGGEQ